MARTLYMRQARAAVRDLATGLARDGTWRMLAWQDIKSRYRGSTLGPFWITAATGVTIFAMGVVFSRVLGMPLTVYLPDLAMGLVLWQFISTLVSEGCLTFLTAQQMILHTPMPLSVHAYRVVFRNFLVFAHTAIIIPAVMLIFRIPPGAHFFLGILGLALYAVNGVWISLLLGMMSARFRDIPPIVANVMQLMYFITPVFWPASNLGNLHWLADINPIFAGIDVVRGAFLGRAVSHYSWPVFLAVTGAGCLSGFILFARFRGRISYWL